MPSISVVRDDRIERLLRDEASQILAVTEDEVNTSLYEIFLSDFPRSDILGMSMGRGGFILVTNWAAARYIASITCGFLRQALAHEIAHEIAGHANYSR
jgi:hypothetical protein